MTGSEAWFGGFWNRTGGHINPLALARGLSQVALKLGAVIYARSPVAGMTRQGDRWLVKTAKGSVTARALVLATNAYTDAFESDLAPAIAAEVVPRAVLADGDPADQRQHRQDDHSRPAGDVGYASRALFRALGRAQPAGDGRCGGVSRGRRRQSAQAGGRAAAAPVAAAGRSLLRLCLVRLYRHDAGRCAETAGAGLSAHPPAGARRLRLGRLQWPGGGAIDIARAGAGAGDAGAPLETLGCRCRSRRPSRCATSSAASPRWPCRFTGLWTRGRFEPRA